MKHDKVWIKIISAEAAFVIAFVVIAIIFNPSPGEFLKIRTANFMTKKAMILIACIFTKYIDKRKLSFLGLDFEKDRSIRIFFIGCLIAAVQMLFIDSAAYISGFVSDGSFNFSIEIIFMGIGIFLVHTVITGISEEMLFRGYILGNLLTKYNETKAVIISAALFTIIHVSSHMTIVNYTDIFLMGIIFAELFLITKSLYMPIGVHFFFDFVQEEIFMIENVNENPYALIKFNVNNELFLGGRAVTSKIEILFVISEIVILIFIYLYKARLKADNNK